MGLFSEITTSASGFTEAIGWAAARGRMPQADGFSDQDNGIGLGQLRRSSRWRATRWTAALAVA